VEDPVRRVAVTGIGVVSPLGPDAETTWEGLIAGRSGIGPITHFDASDQTSRIAGEADGFVPTDWFDARTLRRTDRFLQLALAASRMAVADADLAVEGIGRERVGVYVGSGIGGLETLCDAANRLERSGPRRISPYTIPRLIVNMAPGMIAIEIGARGANFSVVSACATGNHCIGEAFRAIRGGQLDACIAGGSEAPILPLGVASFARMRALSKRNDDPTAASRPFDADRDGFVMAEGAGILVLEELDLARRRGVTILAEVVGYGLTCDAHHVTQPSPDGEGAARCMADTLRDAGLSPAEVGYINAHGTSTPTNDAAETRAIRRVFGDHADRLAVSSTKSATGHLLGAAGGLEAAVTSLALHRGILPPTLNQARRDPACDLDYVPNQAREVQAVVALSNAFGFGGTNACLAFRAMEE
jgi:3-oxoacyl-[acyl-carrier-protein] synthase II